MRVILWTASASCGSSLLQDGKEYKNSVILISEGNGQQVARWKNLPKFAPDGTEFKYTVDELNPPEGYTKTVDGLNIKNTYSVEEPPAPSPEPPAPSPKPPVTAPPALNVFGGFISGQLGDCVD